MKILAIDTSTEACSAALLIDGEITSQYQLAPREHSRLILKIIDKLLSDAKVSVSSLDAVAFGRGPGSFMGLRIAAGVVQGIAFAHDIPVIPISTLKAMAQRAYEQTNIEHVLVAIDARMDEVYWGAYSLVDQQWITDGEECVISPDKIQLPSMLSTQGKNWVAAGTGWGSYVERLLDSVDESGGESEAPNKQFKPAEILVDCFPSAEVIVKLAVKELEAGNTITAAHAIPVYLRNNVAKKPKAVIL
jgi:tRNA threonylcarbamoyladenosine biosynthesis protein TsaB